MEATKNRAAVVSLRDDRLLAIRRTKQRRRYAVLPGGGIELNESAQEAALRELLEETGLPGEVLRHLWTLEHEGRLTDYFLVAVPVAPMVISGPEAQAMSSDNTYEPSWILVADLDSQNLQPATMRPLIRDLAGTP